MKQKFKKIAITTGDPYGIGAEVTIKALKKLQLPKEQVLLISNYDVLDYYGGKDLDYDVVEIPLDAKEVGSGKNTKAGGEFSFQSLRMAADFAKIGKISAIATAPVSKEALHLAGHKFNGQTEVLQHFLAHDNQHAEMLFTANNFRVLLLTRHVPLKEIVLDKDIIEQKIIDINNILKRDYNVENPRLALCGFNPHAGEDGILGKEEQEILIPVAQKLQKQNINVTLPLPADTLFIEGANAYINNKPLPYDCYLACYHDQGLIPIKTIAKDKTVNTTVGLDIIRTSPCHGTAFDIAGKNIADESSMIVAIQEALNH